MQSWHTTYLGLKDLPREFSAFELQAFFTFSRAERAVIDARYGATHKLGLALQDLRHQGPDAEHRVGHAGRRRRTWLRGDVSPAAIKKKLLALVQKAPGAFVLKWKIGVRSAAG